MSDYNKSRKTNDHSQYNGSEYLGRAGSQQVFG